MSCVEPTVYSREKAVFDVGDRLIIFLVDCDTEIFDSILYAAQSQTARQRANAFITTATH